MSKKTEEDPNDEFEKIAFSIEAELIKKGHLHPDGSRVTSANAKEKRVPAGTRH